MKRFTQLLLAIVAASLISWYTEEKPKPLPPDDPADVNTLMEILPAAHIRFDADHNIVEIGLDAADLQKDPRMAPALRRLRHVRTLAIARGADEVLRVARDWPSLEIACLGMGVTDNGFACLKGMRKLKSIQAHFGLVTNEGIKSLGELKELKSLNLEWMRVNDAGLKDIAVLPELKDLELEGCVIKDAGLQHLRAMKLEHLNLGSTYITNRGIEGLKEMKTLKLLELEKTGVSQAACEKLVKEIPGLRVWGARKKEVHVTPDDPKEIAAIEAELGLGDAQIDKDTGTVQTIWVPPDAPKPRIWMKHLRRLHNLKSLTLPNSTEDDDLALLAGLKTLEDLYVSHSNITDAGLKQIGALISLQRLDVSSCRNITSDGLRHLLGLKNVNALVLSYAPVTDDGLRRLAAFPYLQGLELSGTKVTDAGLAHLAGLVYLQGLALGETETTDAGLAQLHALTRLRMFSGGSGVTSDGIKQLGRFAPRLFPDPEFLTPAH